jgi:hypothetical protein
MKKLPVKRIQEEAQELENFEIQGKILPSSVRTPG